jgi:hypothetical protein
MPFKSIKDELHKFKSGELHTGSSSGPIVKKRKQAIAIALSEAHKVNTSPSNKIKSKNKLK